MIRIGGTNRRSSAIQLTQWLLPRASQSGCEHAAQCLHDYLNSDSFQAHEIMLVAGMATNTETKLTDDITIRPECQGG